MGSTRIIFAGGFLGAGKTTLLWKAAKRLMDKNLRVGLVTNDQAPELVDTVLLSQNGLRVAEVCGSCFCCNFNGLTDAIKKIGTETYADIIIAEPVGSCTDLSATIMQPLKKLHKELILSPFSVLVDPFRLRSILSGSNFGLHPDAVYIVRKQLEESDIILINKTDCLQPDELQVLIDRSSQEFPDSKVMTISAASEEGIDAWLDEVTSRTDAGKHIVEVDYDIYAHGEAVLGWLNGTVNLKGDTDWDELLSQLMIALGNQFDSNENAVGHVKVILENGNNYIVGNLTGTVETLSIRGTAGEGKEVKLIINARVETTPDNLENIVKDVLYTATSGLTMEIVAWRCLQPGRPNPTYRYTQVVK